MAAASARGMIAWTCGGRGRVRWEMHADPEAATWRRDTKADTYGHGIAYQTGKRHLSSRAKPFTRQARSCMCAPGPPPADCREGSARTVGRNSCKKQITRVQLRRQVFPLELDCAALTMPRLPECMARLSAAERWANACAKTAGAAFASCCPAEAAQLSGASAHRAHVCTSSRTALFAGDRARGSPTMLARRVRNGKWLGEDTPQL